MIGATAHFGRQTVEALAGAGRKVRALSRTPEKAGLPEGVEVVRGDLARPETLGAALDGVTELFLVLPYGMDAQPLLDRVRQAGVRQIVFLSSGAVVDGADPQPDGGPAPVNDAVEQLTGHPPRPYTQWVTDNLAAFR
ncbi:SDR family oxidoreductase [Kitasatospora purpeofusca]|uniref:SDR family oxidoreductase n=1 Tax=Kitasatospora purpeofusca TaxID=67352 RepID=UPI0035D9096A